MLKSSESLRKFSKSSKIFGHFRKLLKCFKTVFDELLRFMKIFGKFSENFGNGSKHNFFKKFS